MRAGWLWAPRCWENSDTVIAGHFDRHDRATAHGSIWHLVANEVEAFAGERGGSLAVSRKPSFFGSLRAGCSLPRQSVRPNHAPSLHIRARFCWHNATHRCDGIKRDSAEWQFDYGCEFFFYSGRKFFVEKADMRIPRRVYSHSQGLPQVAAQLFERLIRFKPHEKSFRKFS